MSKHKISIAVPAYDYDGYGWFFLSYLLNSIVEQDYVNYEVVISDQSKNDDLKYICEIYSKKIDINYNKYFEFGMGKNFNNAIKNCSGSLIKMMCLDDYFVDFQALTKITHAMENDKNFWLLNGCVHSENMNIFYDRIIPRYHHKIHLGANTISSPSVLTMREKVLFDDKLMMLLDCEMYKRLYINYGDPFIISDPLICNRMHKGQAQKKESDKLQSEIEYCRNLYDE